MVLKGAGIALGYIHRRTYINNSFYGDKLPLEDKPSHGFYSSIVDDTYHSLWDYSNLVFDISADGCLGESNVKTTLHNTGGCRRSAGGADCGGDILGFRGDRLKILKKFNFDNLLCITLLKIVYNRLKTGKYFDHGGGGMRYLHRLIIGILVVLLSFLLILGTGCNCQNQETTGSPSPTATTGKSFIWKISSDTTHVYLLGSVHVATQDLYPLDKTIEDAYASADYLVVEVNTNNLSQIHAGELLVQYGTYPQGDGFKDNVSEELYNTLAEQFRENEIDITLFNDYRPYVIYNFMSQLILKSLGYTIENGIDLYFLNKTDESNKSILELETTEYQLSLMSSIPDEIFIKMMQYDIENEETGKYLQDLFSAWEDGDIAKMETVVFEALVEEPEMAPYYEIMYDQRNINMLQEIEEFLADDEVYFIVVGAGHLVGENGLLNLLQDKGYIVEQLYDSD